VAIVCARAAFVAGTSRAPDRAIRVPRATNQRNGAEHEETHHARSYHLYDDLSKPEETEFVGAAGRAEAERQPQVAVDVHNSPMDTTAAPANRMAAPESLSPNPARHRRGGTEK
jgi:hypothetical protein